MTTAQDQPATAERRALSWVVLIGALLAAVGFGTSLTPWTTVGLAGAAGLVATVAAVVLTGTALQARRRLPTVPVIVAGLVIIVTAVLAIVLAATVVPDFGSPLFPTVAALGGLGVVVGGAAAR